jgi:hypothetical protein
MEAKDCKTKWIILGKTQRHLGFGVDILTKVASDLWPARPIRSLAQIGRASRKLPDCEQSPLASFGLYIL